MKVFKLWWEWSTGGDLGRQLVGFFVPTFLLLMTVSWVMGLDESTTISRAEVYIDPSSCGGWSGVENEYCSFDTTGQGISIGANSCTGVHSCPDLRIGSTIGENSCDGYASCQKNEGFIGDDSCRAEALGHACYMNLGEIGHGSCRANNACLGNQGSVGDNACNGDSACRGNQGTIPDNSRND